MSGQKKNRRFGLPCRKPEAVSTMSDLVGPLLGVLGAVGAAASPLPVAWVGTTGVPFTHEIVPVGPELVAPPEPPRRPLVVPPEEPPVPPPDPPLLPPLPAPLPAEAPPPPPPPHHCPYAAWLAIMASTAPETIQDFTRSRFIRNLLENHAPRTGGMPAPTRRSGHATATHPRRNYEERLHSGPSRATTVPST